MSEESPQMGEGAVSPQMGEAIEPYLPEAVVVDPSDKHEVMVRMDEHDVRMLLEHVQTSALRKWVYELEQGRDPKKWPRGLTVHAVQDIVQWMNWTGKTRIGLLKDAAGRPVLEVEQITADEGGGPEPFWIATAYAVDEVTGSVWAGASMEPQRMTLTEPVARARRAKGQIIGEDRKVFDRFSRQKAIQKAQRNAAGAFIPEEVEQTVIAMFANDPSRVERLRTEAEAKALERPPALTDDRAKDLIAKAESLYDEIRLIGGAALVEFTPAKFAAWVRDTQHDHGRLEALVTFVESERDRLTEKYGPKEAS